MSSDSSFTIAWIGLVAVLGGATIGLVGQGLTQRVSRGDSFRSLKRHAYSYFLTQANAASRLLGEIESFNKYLDRVRAGIEQPEAHLLQKIKERTPEIRGEFQLVTTNLDRAIADVHLSAPIEVLTRFTDLQKGIWAVWQEKCSYDDLDDLYRQAAVAARMELRFDLRDDSILKRALFRTLVNKRKDNAKIKSSDQSAN